MSSVFKPWAQAVAEAKENKIKTDTMVYAGQADTI
jgi:hypothetical protein